MSRRGPVPTVLATVLRPRRSHVPEGFRPDGLGDGRTRLSHQDCLCISWSGGPEPEKCSFPLFCASKQKMIVLEFGAFLAIGHPGANQF
eukprot:6414285-Lingulodinium_polyedra.AAC.1